MQIEKKYISRKGWRCILKSSFSYKVFNSDYINGIAGLLRLEKIREPLVTTVLGQHLTIVDEGYLWMQIAPQGKNWWLSVMIDREKHIIQYYFDVTKENILHGAESYFLDLFLDVVALPDGTVALLDQDELDAALTEGVITEIDYNIAIDTADMLIKTIPSNIKSLEKFCNNLICELEVRL